MVKLVAQVALILLIWLHGVPAHAAPSDCIGQSADGRAICLPPEPGARSVGGCIDTQLSAPTALFSTCATANGYPGSGSDQPLINTYNCMLGMFGVSPISSLNWLPEGTYVNNLNCWTGTVRYKWGMEVEGYGSNYPQGYFGLWARSSRSFSCRAGEAPVYGTTGQLEYCKPPIPSYGTCEAGNPTQPDTGVKVERSVDYEGAGAHPLRFERTYRSYWYPRPPGAGLGPNWTHNYAASVHAPLGYIHGTRYAYVVRPTGELQYFARTSASSVWEAASRSRHRLEERLDAAGQRIGWTLRIFDDDSVENYDAAGKLTRIAARNGWITTLVYSDANTPVAVAPSAGLLIAVRNHFGRELELIYDAQARVAEFLSPGAIAGLGAGSAASPIRYGYNEAASLGTGVPAQNQLTSVTWQDGTLRRYHHDSAATALHPSLLTGITDEVGVRYANFGYHGGGKVAFSEHIGGVDRIEFDYGAGNASAPGPNFSSVAVRDFPGGTAQTRTYGFTSVGNARYPSTLSAPCSLCGNTFASYGYDAAGQLTKAIAHDGKVTFYAYDAKGRETERAVFAASYASATTRPALSLAESVVSSSWHTTFNLPLMRAEPAKLTTYGYDVAGSLTAESWIATKDPTGARGFAARKDGSTYATGRGYNAQGLPASIAKKTGNKTTGTWTLAYNAAGDVINITATEAGTSAVGTLTSSTSHGLLTELRADNGAVARFGYDTRNKLRTAELPDYGATLTYDSRSLLTEVRFGASSWLRIVYDPAGNPLRLEDSSGQSQLIVGLTEPSGLWPQSEAVTTAAAARMRALMSSLRDLATTTRWLPLASARAQLPPPPVMPARILQGISLAQTQQAALALDMPNLARERTCCSAGGPGQSQAVRDYLSRVTMPIQMMSYAATQVSEVLANEILIQKSAYKLRKSLCTAGVTVLAGCYSAHHIVAVAAPGASAGRLILANVGIDINDAANGMFEPCDQHGRLHTNVYYAKVNIQLAGATQTRPGIEAELGRIRTSIASGTY